MAKNKFEKELTKILDQGVIYAERGEKDRDSCVYVLDVNMDGLFAVRRYRYWSGAVRSRKPIEEWAYNNADDAIARFEEIKKYHWAQWNKESRLTYCD
jgi:hypothetical protein